MNAFLAWTVGYDLRRAAAEPPRAPVARKEPVGFCADCGTPIYQPSGKRGGKPKRCPRHAKEFTLNRHKVTDRMRHQRNRTA